ncbi:(deoxy)nucleoside triphosphate pyrophosphohydrolase [Labilibaculum sp.]|uniref:(deoxy)nucleoside triphosphate pyrophosphohydrolase n=1 Tax=Labilibaculum sp. TaxID=2060723 RepID=UPI002AA8C2F8|nr:(deoxy)nucleoside triphosphate pyrophosphohydrolase [Labilibaculum sp.]MBN2595316.1 (deoxy)nucleoside triphosphate pyrophosphohydrolase [Marinifilaceae bacterium]
MEPIKVTAAIIIKNGKVFIAQRSKDDELSGKWEFPGGKIESDETPQECLRRELFEEFGIETKVLDYFGDSIFDYGNKPIHLLSYFAEHLSGELILKVHQNYKWIEFSELDQINWAAADIELAKQLKQKLAEQ